MTSARTSAHRWVAVVLGGAMVVSACGSTVVSTGATIGSPMPEASATPAAPSVEPSAEPSAEPSVGASSEVGALCAVDLEPCQIEAGTYVTTPFEPAFAFTIGEPWRNDRNFADGGGISTELGGLFWSSGISTGMVGESEVTFESTIEGFTEHLRSIDGFTVTDGGSASIGGEPATVVDVLTNDTLARGVYFIEDDVYSLAHESAARFYLLELDGTLVTFVVESWVWSDFEAVSEQLQPVLDSVAWQ